MAVLRRPKALILTTLGAGAAFAFQVTMATFAQTYAVQNGADRPPVLLGYSVASFLAIFGVLLRGPAVRPVRPPARCSWSACLVWAALAFPFFALWGSGNALLIYARLRHRPAVPVADLRPARRVHLRAVRHQARYTGASLGYQLATLLGGGFTPALLATLFRNSGGEHRPGGASS